MFGSYDIFGFLSRYTFGRIDTYNYNKADSCSTPNLNDTSTPSGDVAGSDSSGSIAPLPKEAVPGDVIELSNTNPIAPDNLSSASYSPETVKAAGEEAGAAEGTEQNEQTEQTEEPANTNTLAGVKSKMKMSLKMVFNLSDFQSLVSAVAEDAKDGSIDTLSYSDLSLGLHADLKARASVKEYYQVGEGQEGPLPTSHYKERLKYNNLEASMLKSRGFEAGMFYRESMRASFRIRQTYSDGFMQVARKLSLRYTQDFKLNMRTMNLFNSQAAALDQSGDLQPYLGNAEALVDSPRASGELINQFFDTVESYLNGAEDQMIEKIDAFFDNMVSEMGLDSTFLDSARESMISSIEDFFGNVEQAVSSIESSYIPASTTIPEQVEPPVDPVVVPEPELAAVAETLTES